jgi:hypothetical protein
MIPSIKKYFNHSYTVIIVINCKKCNLVKLKKQIKKCIGEKFCVNCAKSLKNEHQCYLSKDKHFEHENKFNSYIFYDYECIQENTINMPNLVNARKVCKDCVEKKEFCKEKCELQMIHGND